MDLPEDLWRQIKSAIKNKTLKVRIGDAIKTRIIKENDKQEYPDGDQARQVA